MKTSARKILRRAAMGRTLLSALVAGSVFVASSAAAEQSSAHAHIAADLLLVTQTLHGESNDLKAIGGTRLRAIGGTRLRAIGGTRLRAIGGTYLRAIGGTRLRADDEPAYLQAIGGTRLRSTQDEAELHAIGGTRLRAIGGTRLRAEEGIVDVQAIGGTRLRAIGGTRLRSAEVESGLNAIGGTRLRATDDAHSTQAIGGTRLRAIDNDSISHAIGGTRLRVIDAVDEVQAIGGTRLRAIGGTRLRAIGGTRLRADDGSDQPEFAADGITADDAEHSAFLVGPESGFDIFVLGPITGSSAQAGTISILNQVIEVDNLSYGDQLADAQIGRLALIIGSSATGDGILAVSDEWFIPGATPVATLARVQHVNLSGATLELKTGVTVDYSATLSGNPELAVQEGDLVFISGIAY